MLDLVGLALQRYVLLCCFQKSEVYFQSFISFSVEFGQGSPRDMLRADSSCLCQMGTLGRCCWQNLDATSLQAGFWCREYSIACKWAFLQMPCLKSIIHWAFVPEQRPEQSECCCGRSRLFSEAGRHKAIACSWETARGLGWGCIERRYLVL